MATLDADVRNELIRLMNQFLEMEKEAPEQAAQAWKIWKTENIYQFIYGHWIGYFTGLSEGIIQGRYKRDLSFDERNEIIKLVEEFAPKLREYLAPLRN